MRRTKKKDSVIRMVPTINIVCGIDSGKISGYSIYRIGRYISSGIVKSAYDRYEVISHVRDLSVYYQLPILFISENWPSSFLPNGKRMSHDSILGMGASWGMWSQEIDKISDARMVIKRINTLVWRRRYGLHKYPKEQAKKLALALASNEVNKKITDHNEAEAILIAKVGCYMELK